MDLGLSEQQEMLKKMARDFLATECPKKLVRDMEDDKVGHPVDLWQKMAELGWHGLVIPEEFGGQGYTFLDLAVLVEEMGRGCLPGPFFSTVVLAGFPLLDLGTDAQKKEYLPKIANGEIVMTLALSEHNANLAASGISATAAAGGKGYKLNGAKLFVPFAHVSDYILVAAKTDDKKPDINLFIVNAKSSGVSIKIMPTMSNDKQCEVTLKDVEVAKENVITCGWSGLEKTLQKIAIAECIQMLGGAQMVLEMTVEYAKTRIQFERPIGSFQAIQHHCANMAVDLESSRLMTYRAAWLISEDLEFMREASEAKVWIDEACRRIMTLGHQIHGAIGFTWDHDMQLYSRRAVIGRVSYGDSDYHRDMVGFRV